VHPAGGPAEMQFCSDCDEIAQMTDSHTIRRCVNVSIVEIMSGIDDRARVVSNPNDALAEGIVVEPIMHSADSDSGAKP
jgi:hypothetical protein